ncbi:GntR family transcriptional regulator [Nocardia sp. alder85J]|uniref:GntR family transcriptional regulator n=1 Tax=Nocardia sp. alder85J TaxID=2862949 RepID=UPI001CD69F24|nr:GntR family transcriptional regulator [Nocardia sp. alder85J]MCX4095607.1 GntR family transcriptional regulator [Nocardia sp. alder85J]
MEDTVIAVKPVRRERLVDGVVDQLRTLILGGALPPGQTLQQRALAAQLGVSRTPLREALYILAEEGFLRSSNGHNTLEVINHSAEEMVELYQFREVIDGLAARLAARRGVSEADLADLGRIVDEMHSLTVTADWPRRAALHADLHAGIAELSGNPHVAAHVPMIRFTAQMRARNLDNFQDVDPVRLRDLVEQGEAEHLELLAAIRDQDGRRAETLARRHIRKSVTSPPIRPARGTVPLAAVASGHKLSRPRRSEATA